MDYIDVCLVNINTGVPFISSLELRPLNNSIYRTDESSKSLVKLGRNFFGQYAVGTPVRFKDDIHDRTWDPQSTSGFTLTSANANIESTSDYRPPSSVMRTAISSSSTGSWLYYSWTPPEIYPEYYLCLHFAEILISDNSAIRQFDIYLYGTKWYPESIALKLLSSTTICSNSSSNSSSIDFSFSPTNISGRPPLLNAIEIYKFKDFSQSPTELDSVNGIFSVKEFYDVKKNWQGDPCIPDEYKWDGLSCTNARITTLNLSSSGLAGMIAPAIANLSSLQFLDLSYNSLNGTIPEFLGNLRFLKVLNLTGNNLIGFIPPNLIDKNSTGLLSLSVDGNALECTELCNVGNGKNRMVIVLVTAAAFGALLILLVGLFFYLKFKRKGHRDQSIRKGSVNSGSQRFIYSQTYSGRKFTNTEITSITSNFNKILGKGGCGTVYQGHLEEGTPVAIKMIARSSSLENQFHTEVKLLMRIHHRNLASLVGYCDEGVTMALVYEYMDNGNLQEHLLGKITSILSWKERVQIAVDAAQGLEYLHSGCKPPIIHRDVKSANILLNEKLQAKIADFGLSRILSESKTHVSTQVAGTLGYLDPEYHMTCNLTEKSDVYSFGIVLLELITGKPAIMKSNNQLLHIIQWVNLLLAKGDIQEIVDSRLEDDLHINSAWKLLEAAMSCVPDTAIQRPSMGQVLTQLKECLLLLTNYEMSKGKKSTETRETDHSMVLEFESFPSAR